ncbi:MAG TPA: hypothetical protein VL860_06175 [Planctomycetota bacterium]|nr:hypothetical protein [Planctomycetota bacterium]
MQPPITASQLAQAENLVAETRANGGLAPVNLEQFWADETLAASDPFSHSAPQVVLGIRMGSEAVFDELGIPEDWHRLYHDDAWRIGLNKQYNDRAEVIVGRRLLDETAPDPRRRYPAVKELYDIFEGRNEWHSESYWLHQAANTPQELAALLDRVELRLENLRAFLLPENWVAEKQRLSALGIKPPLYRSQRGPVTFATSIYGVENLIFLYYDNRKLMQRYRDLILRAMLERKRILDEEAGYTPATAPHGFYVLDDNSAQLNAKMYEFFGYPILQGLFAQTSPAPGDRRGQHSDSDMGHLLPILGRLNLTTVNFGPKLSVREIREFCPQAVIDGQLAPFTFSRNEEVNMVTEFLRDAEQAREKRGLRFATAGSINNGSRLTGMRLLMAAIQRHGRYQ